MNEMEKALISFKKGNNDHRLVPKMIEAASCNATSGEMMECMKKTLGWLNSAVLAPV